MYESPRIRRLKSDLAALESLRAESTVFGFKASGTPAQQYLSAIPRQEPGARSGQGHRPRSPRGRDQARRLVSADDARAPLDLTPIYHPNISEIGMVCLGRLRHALGPQPGPGRALRDALGHGPVSELRHPEPLQPRGRPVGREPVDLPVPDGPPPAPRRPRGARPDRRAELDRAMRPHPGGESKFPKPGASTICILDEIDLARASPRRPGPDRQEVDLPD